MSRTYSTRPKPRRADTPKTSYRRCSGEPRQVSYTTPTRARSLIIFGKRYSTGRKSLRSSLRAVLTWTTGTCSLWLRSVFISRIIDSPYSLGLGGRNSSKGGPGASQNWNIGARITLLGTPRKDPWTFPKALTLGCVPTPLTAPHSANQLGIDGRIGVSRDRYVGGL